MAMYDGDNTYNGVPLSAAIYNTAVKNAGCHGASDTIACLRELDYTKFLNTANSVPGIMAYNSVPESYLPRPDGLVLTALPEKLVIQGKYSSVPFVISDQEDEGTIFALYQNNLTTAEHIVDYLYSLYFFDTSRRAD
ncbi:Carboxylesterase type B [Penicillium fimorum]|uniref:Carboxylesterase type B n=1 Tax=Penicillium fimorum TaxID=1882269 RepID=A0A9W9XM76_9EURO|nr:Carboxylesterase type B [Penicillium fimorum]